MRLQGSVAKIAAALPDICGLAAFPIAAYDRFRSLYDVPAPPMSGGNTGFVVVLSAIGMPLDALYDHLAALESQTDCHWQLAVVGADAAQRRVSTALLPPMRGSFGLKLVEATQERARNTGSPLTSR